MKRFFQVGIIRVVTSDNPEFIAQHGNIIEENFPGIRCESKCIPDQPEGIHSRDLHTIAVPKILKVAESFTNIDMFIVSCADDPAVEELRERFPGIPVTGGGESTAALASKYGEKIAVLGITDYLPPAYARMIPEKIIACEKPRGVDSTLDLLTEKGRQSCLEKAVELKSRGAQVIALACTGLTTIGITKELENAVGIPVIDPVLAEGTFAYFEMLRKK